MYSKTSQCQTSYDSKMTSLIRLSLVLGSIRNIRHTESTETFVISCLSYPRFDTSSHDHSMWQSQLDLVMGN